MPVEEFTGKQVMALTLRLGKISQEESKERSKALELRYGWHIHRKVRSSGILSHERGNVEGDGVKEATGSKGMVKCEILGHVSLLENCKHRGTH
jgi:hypothetical protein